MNAVYRSTRPLEEKIAYCERLYGRAGLPALFRITPFCEPPTLDAALELRGYGRFETTAVESADIAEVSPPETVRDIPLDAWVHAIGDIRASPAAHRNGHLARLAGLPLALRPVALDSGGRIVATGLLVVEDAWAGLFDIVTREEERGRGHARTIVAGLLARARQLGARHAYLQVRADNEPARRLYRQFGFQERYVYWYRGREPEQG